MKTIPICEEVPGGDDVGQPRELAAEDAAELEADFSGMGGIQIVAPFWAFPLLSLPTPLPSQGLRAYNAIQPGQRHRGPGG